MDYKTFIDESGNKDYLNPYSKEFIDKAPLFFEYPKFWQDNYFVLCGVRIKQDDLGMINLSINKLKKQCFGTHHVEVKSDWLRNPYKRKKHYLDAFQITPEQLNIFGDNFIEMIAGYKREIKLFAVVFDKRFYGNSKRKTADGRPLLKTTQILMERIHYAGGSNTLIFDQMESSLKWTHGSHDKILNVYRRNEGMDRIFVDSYSNIKNIIFMKSSMENFLQVADICAYNVYRQFLEYGREWSGVRRDVDGKTKMGVYKYFDKIRCNFAYYPNISRRVRGVGLTCLPDSEKLNWNLMKGCFEEVGYKN
jgi:hypothetical protein